MAMRGSSCGGMRTHSECDGNGRHSDIVMETAVMMETAVVMETAVMMETDVMMETAVVMETAVAWRYTASHCGTS